MSRFFDTMKGTNTMEGILMSLVRIADALEEHNALMRKSMETAPSAGQSVEVVNSVVEELSSCL